MSEKVNKKQTSGKAKAESAKAQKETPKTKKPKINPNLKENRELKEKNSELNDKYLRLSAEFDNYRKRTLKEKMDLVKSGGESVLLSVLPVVDNLERAIQSIRDAKDTDAVKEGIELIYNRFKEFLTQNGIKPIECLHEEFDIDAHEAVTKIPAPEPELKGKIVDVIEKGYYLHDRVIRYSKVVIGE